MSNIYLIRHGQTDMNLVHGLQGHIDTQLNDVGRSQASSAGKYIQMLELEHPVIYSSPLQRAFETTCIVSGFKEQEIIIDERLKEMGFGDYEGIPMEETPRSFRSTLFDKTSQYIPTGDGETISGVTERMLSFFKEITNKYSSQNRDVIAISHGAAIHALMVALYGLDMDDFWSFDVYNCAVVKIDSKKRLPKVIFEGFMN